MIIYFCKIFWKTVFELDTRYTAAFQWKLLMGKQCYFISWIFNGFLMEHENKKELSLTCQSELLLFKEIAILFAFVFQVEISAS